MIFETDGSSAALTLTDSRRSARPLLGISRKRSADAQTGHCGHTPGGGLVDSLGGHIFATRHRQ